MVRGRRHSWIVGIIVAARNARKSLGRSLSLPDQVMGYVIDCPVEGYLLIGAGGRLTMARPSAFSRLAPREQADGAGRTHPRVIAKQGNRRTTSKRGVGKGRVIC
jgi:hypothetical protein